MSGIPVYTRDPINPSKASGVTPQTQRGPPRSDASPPTTTAASSSSSSSYPVAQPGAAAVPAPTSAAQHYAPVQPTSTTKTDLDIPPPPQPGSVPTPLASSSKIPPPPKANEKSQAPQQPYPPQMSIPPPTAAYGGQPPASSSSMATTSSSANPVNLPTAWNGTPRRSLEHPPGYQQNKYASDSTSDPRWAQGTSNSSGLGDSPEKTGGIDTEDVWNTAKQWISAAGEKLSQTEAEIWRRISKE